MNTIYSAKNISKSFGIGGFQLSPLDIEIKPSEIVGVVGENGNGKTTLLRIIAGDLSADLGEITCLDNKIDTKNWNKYKNKIAYIPQRIPKWYGNLRDNLIFQATLKGIKNQDELVDNLVKKLGLEKYIDYKWSQISTGYRLRFQLAKILIGKPNLLVLDEPIANLDVNAQEKFLSDLRHIVSDTQQNVGVIFSSQQLNEVENISDQVIFLSKGKLIYGGDTEKIGDQRNENSFEFQGSLSDELIKELFPNSKIQKFGKTFRIDSPLEITAEILLKKLLEKNCEIKYFRNISNSTKRMF